MVQWRKVENWIRDDDDAVLVKMIQKMGKIIPPFPPRKSSQHPSLLYPQSLTTTISYDAITSMYISPI